MDDADCSTKTFGGTVGNADGSDAGFKGDKARFIFRRVVFARNIVYELLKLCILVIGLDLRAAYSIPI